MSWQKFIAAFIFCCVLIVAWTLQADAKGFHHHHHHRLHHVARAHHFTRKHAAYDASGNSGSVIGGRPTGCPARFCGCGLRKYLGFSDKSLDLAWEWAIKFPRTFAHAGAAAVRHGHVMLIERMTGPSTAIVRDYNGGRHLSWLHERNLRGYVFVEPGGRKVAMAF
jgi:hypothetical protein